MKNKYLKSKCGYDMQGENQNTEKSRITERVRSWEKYGGWTNLKNAYFRTGLHFVKFWGLEKIKNQTPNTRL